MSRSTNPCGEVHGRAGRAAIGGDARDAEVGPGQTSGDGRGGVGVAAVLHGSDDGAAVVAARAKASQADQKLSTTRPRPLRPGQAFERVERGDGVGRCLGLLRARQPPCAKIDPKGFRWPRPAPPPGPVAPSSSAASDEDVEGAGDLRLSAAVRDA